MSDHPIAHVPTQQAHEWMRAECAALDAARQAREDNLMNVIIQTSSAAVLAIPALFLASETPMPAFAEAWPVYVGTAAFGLAFACACLEQILSGMAYRAQRDVVQKYYAQESEKTCDEATVGRADLVRSLALAIFAIAVSLGGLGLAQFARGIDVEAPGSPKSALTARHTDSPSPVPTIPADGADASASTQSSPNSQSSTSVHSATNSKSAAITPANVSPAPVRAGAQIKPRADPPGTAVTEKAKVN